MSPSAVYASLAVRLCIKERTGCIKYGRRQRGRMESQETILECFELQDGEYFCLQQKDSNEDEDVTDQIVISREVALDLAHTIIKLFA